MMSRCPFGGGSQTLADPNYRSATGSSLALGPVMTRSHVRQRDHASGLPAAGLNPRISRATKDSMLHAQRWQRAGKMAL